MPRERISGIPGNAFLPSSAFVAAALSLSAPAAAQISDAELPAAMRACSVIDDATARLACYDNAVRPGGVTGQRPASSTTTLTDQSSAAAFGADSVKTAERFQSAEEKGRGPDAIRTRVIDARERQPGIYLVTIEDDAQWLFIESVPRNFRPPRKNALVEIKRASLGSFLMIVDGQTAVRVRRVR